MSSWKEEFERRVKVVADFPPDVEVGFIMNVEDEWTYPDDTGGGGEACVEVYWRESLPVGVDVHSVHFKDFDDFLGRLDEVPDAES